jgi:hypothetical protein
MSTGTVQAGPDAGALAPAAGHAAGEGAGAGSAWRLGLLYVMSVPYVAGVASIGDWRIAGFRYTGFVWAAMLAGGGLLILGRKWRRLRFPVVLWLPWFAFVPLSLAWSAGHGLGNFQDALQIVTPLVVGIVASMAVEREAELRRLRRAFMHCMAIAWAGYAFWVSSLSGEMEVAFRPMALTACFAGCIFVASLQEEPLWSLTGWGACLALAFLGGSRVATFALLVVWAACPLLGRLPVRLIVLAVVAAAALALFFTGVFQERFFGPEGGGLSQVAAGDFDSGGRFETWPLIWHEAREHLVLGHGVGESRGYVAQVWPGTDKPHNDYLRIIFEQGIVGIALFVGVAVAQIWALRQLVARHRGEVRMAFASAYLGLIVLLVVAFTDNPISYGVWYMHPLFAVLGAAYGVAARPGRTASPGATW